ncbi:hypothetical protein HYU10_03325 [Candidatus Woesearchaeota archaeon]|nr:hypothetical protein [Candidatus Woesearchaeota archaeon]
MIAMKKELDRAGRADAGVKKERMPMTLAEKVSVGLIAIVGVMIIMNQVQLSGINSAVSGSGNSDFSKFIKSMSPLKSSSSIKGGVIVGPQMNPDGRTTKLVEWPTISETPAPEDTGNPTQDAINYVVPRGTPFYVLEGPGIEKIKGASFDDPLTSQKVWASLLGSRRFGSANELKLTPEEQDRWDRVVGRFTCDYCCGGPNSVTPIKNCGCAHSYAWQGMAKFFIKYYPQYTDEQIAGEMTKWKGLWYPQGMIQDYLVYTGQQPASILTHGGSIGIKQQFLQQGSGNGQSTQASAVPLEGLPSMVGGC